jgi:hypothetical protein
MTKITLHWRGSCARFACRSGFVVHGGVIFLMKKAFPWSDRSFQTISNSQWSLITLHAMQAAPLARWEFSVDNIAIGETPLGIPNVARTSSANLNSFVSSKHCPTNGHPISEMLVRILIIQIRLNGVERGYGRFGLHTGCVWRFNCFNCTILCVDHFLRYFEIRYCLTTKKKSAAGPRKPDLNRTSLPRG